jgi:hypothetical protein
MRTLTGPEGYLAGLGMTSLVSGVLALFLSILPPVGVCLAAFGIVFGILGLVGALVNIGPSMRASLAGLATCLTALALSLAIAYAPSGYLQEPLARPGWNPPPDRPITPAPAARRWYD